MSPKVSVIVPVYNVSEYLGQCLDTILLQTLQDIEVICVDDGSTDDSLSILQTYAMFDERMKVIHQENAGPGAARNRGLKEAKGEFIIFLDSDDFFHPEMLEKMLAKAKEDEADIVVCGVTFFDNTIQKDCGEEMPSTQFLAISPIVSKEHPDDLFFCRGWMCQKLVKRNLIVDNGMQFSDLQFQEDIPYTHLMFALANKISLISDCFVHYRIKRECSLVTESKKTVPNYCEPWKILWNDLKKNNLETYYENAFKSAFFREVSWSFNRKTAEEKKEILKRFCDDFSDDIKHVLFGICDGKNKISLVISTYNSGEFLAECLDSCLKQTLKEIEIICVDDGSTDNSGDILNEYAQKDSRIKVIHQENQGLSSSRNNAMKLTTGEYIQFLDADDWINPETCEYLYLYSKIYGLDMLSFAAKEFQNDTRLEFDKPYHCLKWLPEKTCTTFYWWQIGNILPQLAVTSVLTIYRRAYLQDRDIQWIDKKIAYEDTPFFTESLLSGAQFGAWPIQFYHKRVHEAAITQNMSTNFPDYCWICQYTLEKIYKQMGMSIVFIQYLYTFMNKLYMNYEKLDPNIQKNMLGSLYDFCFNVLKKYHMPLDKKCKCVCQLYLCKKSVLKKLVFSFFSVLAKWRQTGYSLNPIKISFKPFSVSFFGKVLIWKNDIFVPKIKRKEMPGQDRFIVCFDNINDGFTECIDSYTFFKWLQKNGIPSKYIIHPQNPLAQELVKRKDIILSDKDNFFLNCADILSKSKSIVTSFGLYNLNRFVKRLPWINYIFIEHGITLLKHSVLKVYTQKDFDYILVPSQPTANLYKKKRVWKNRQIKCGMPRWDNLKRANHNEKNILTFFTWRQGIHKYSTAYNEYKNKISNFLNSERLITLLKENNISLNIAMHHEMTLEGKIQYPEYVKLIPQMEISKIIRSMDLIITDYSSLAFDFMFLDIPTIFYRFDDDIRYPDKRDRLNAKSAKSHDKELYNVFYDEDAVIEKIEFYIKNNFVLEPEYKKINDSLFWEKENICEHLYEKIKEL